MNIHARKFAACPNNISLSGWHAPQPPWQLEQLAFDFPNTTYQGDFMDANFLLLFSREKEEEEKQRG